MLLEAWEQKSGGIKSLHGRLIVPRLRARACRGSCREGAVIIPTASTGYGCDTYSHCENLCSHLDPLPLHRYVYTHAPHHPSTLYQWPEAAPKWQAVQDTKEIIDYFETLSIDSSISQLLINSIPPQTHALTFAAMFKELSANEWSAVHGMFWRWSNGVWWVEDIQEWLKWLEWDFWNMRMAGQSCRTLKEIRWLGRELRIALFPDFH